MATLYYTLLVCLPALVAVFSVLVTIALLPLVWARLEAPMAVDEPADWSALDRELDAAPTRRARHPWSRRMTFCMPRVRRCRRAHWHRPCYGLHVAYPDWIRKIGVFGVLARGVPSSNYAKSLRKSRVGGRGPPPHPGRREVRGPSNYNKTTFGSLQSGCNPLSPVFPLA